jgi:hypothetical protein
MSKLTDRWIEPQDVHTLELCLERDPHHVGTRVEFFYRPGTVTKVYEDDEGPILFLRGEGLELPKTKLLRVDVQYVSNEATERNRMAMLDGFPSLVEKAKANGFTEILFYTNARALSIFCQRNFGFKEVAKGELRKKLI